MDQSCYEKIVKLCKGKSATEVKTVIENLALSSKEWLELRKICGRRKSLYNLRSRCWTRAFEVASSMADWVVLAEETNVSCHRLRALQEMAKRSITGVEDLHALRNSKLTTLSFLGWFLLGGPDEAKPHMRNMRSMASI